MTTWRLFPDRQSAQDYADACWAGYLKRAAPEQSPDRAKISKYPDDVDQTAAQLQKADLVNTKVLGVDSRGRVVTGSGETTAWAVPMETNKGQWAVPCPPWDSKGEPEPGWPIVDLP